MAYCSNCGKELATGAKFCFECGSPVNNTDATATLERRTIYDGAIHKCPNCGELINSFVLNCPSCGFELRSTKASKVVKEFEQRYTQTANITEKIDLIKAFAVPNTKEDILEFAILASSNIDLKAYGCGSDPFKGVDTELRELSDAWLSKFEQSYQKAQLMFGSCNEFSNLERLYHSRTKQIEKQKLQQVWLALACIGGLFLFLGYILIIVAIGGGFG